MIDYEDIWDDDDQPIALTTIAPVITGEKTLALPDVPDSFAEAIAAFQEFRSTIDIESLADTPEFTAEVEADALIDTDPQLKLSFDAFVVAIRNISGTEISLGQVRSKLKGKYPALLSNVTIARAFVALENQGCGKAVAERNTLKFKSSIVK